MKMTNKIIRITFITLLFVIGLFLTIIGFNNSFISIKYQENNSINYKVYLKENNYFESPYLGENRTYITSLIDYINVNYHYNLKFSEKVSGEYSYYINAKVLANKPNKEEGYYWSKEYKLLPKKTIKVNNSDMIKIEEIVNIDYGKYNSILEDFKKDYSIQTDGLLQVQLIVKSKVTGEEFTKSINVPSNLNLKIPLLEKAVEASIETNAVSNDNELVMIDPIATRYRLIARVSGIIIIILTLLLILRIVLVRIENRNNHLYIATLKKFVDSHDSIIANITNLPDISNLNIIKVSSFEELIDVYNEVRMPINFYENKRKDKAIFMIINDTMCWEYIFSKEDIENN